MQGVTTPKRKSSTQADEGETSDVMRNKKMKQQTPSSNKPSSSSRKKKTVNRVATASNRNLPQPSIISFFTKLSSSPNIKKQSSPTPTQSISLEDKENHDVSSSSNSTQMKGLGKENKLHNKPTENNKELPPMSSLKTPTDVGKDENATVVISLVEQERDLISDTKSPMGKKKLVVKKLNPGSLSKQQLLPESALESTSVIHEDDTVVISLVDEEKEDILASKEKSPTVESDLKTLQNNKRSQPSSSTTAALEEPKTDTIDVTPATSKKKKSAPTHSASPTTDVAVVKVKTVDELVQTALQKNDKDTASVHSSKLTLYQQTLARVLKFIVEKLPA